MTNFLIWLMLLIWACVLVYLSNKTNSEIERKIVFGMALASCFCAMLIPAYSLYNKAKNTQQLQLQNDRLTHALDSLRTKQTPCPDTHYIFMPPPMR